MRPPTLIVTTAAAIVCAVAMPHALRGQAPPPGRAVFTGRIRSSLDSTPVRTADIRLVFIDSARTSAANKDSVEIFADTARSRVGVTDADGAFAIRRVAAGRYMLQIRRMGFEPLQGVLIADTGTVRGDFTMQVTSQLLSKVTVTESSVDLVKQRLDIDGYLDRAHSGVAGTFIDRKEILRRRSQTVADILAVYGIYDDHAEFQLDRMPVDYELLRDYPADLVIGVEIYRHGRPTEFNMTRRGPGMLSSRGPAASMQPMILVWTFIR